MSTIMASPSPSSTQGSGPSPFGEDGITPASTASRRMETEENDDDSEYSTLTSPSDWSSTSSPEVPRLHEQWPSFLELTAFLERTFMVWRGLTRQAAGEAASSGQPPSEPSGQRGAPNQASRKRRRGDGPEEREGERTTPPRVRKMKRGLGSETSKPRFACPFLKKNAQQY